MSTRWSIWSVGLLAVAVGCGADDPGADPFGASGADGGAAGGFLSGSSGSSSSAGGNPGGSGLCHSTVVQSGRVSPDILIVLDRSLSMRQNGVNRWDPSVAGLKSITSMLQDRVSFGLWAFPGPTAQSGSGGMGGRGNNDSSCEPGNERVPMGRGNAGQIASALDAMQPGGHTPTAATLSAARQSIAKRSAADPDSKAVPQYVLLVTDGAPNCSDGATSGGSEPAAVDQSVAEIAAMTKDGIRTYVLGYDTQNDAMLKASLDRMAQAGGTGEKAHRPIENEASLVTQFQQITEVALGCEFVLDAAVANQSYVLVQLDGKQLNVDTDNGWRLNGDKRTVVLQGSACSTIKKTGHVLAVSVECEQVGTVF